MKKYKQTIFILIISLVFGQQLNAQNISVYGLNKAFTKNRILRLKKTPDVYTVYSTQNVFEKATKIKKVSKKYQDLKTHIKLLEIKEKEIRKIYDDKVATYNTINLIPEKINEFLTSNKPFAIKKRILKQAQILADKHNVKENIYGDQTTNPSFKSRFLVYSLEKIELKIHLKRIVSRIKSTNIKPDPFDKNIIPELEILREKLKKTKPFIYSNGPLKKSFSNVLSLGNKIEKVDDLTGDFKILDEFYIIKKDISKKFKKGQLITVVQAKAQNLNYSDIVDTNSIYVIESIGQSISKKYTVDKRFFKNYGYTFDGKFRYQVADFLSDAISLN